MFYLFRWVWGLVFIIIGGFGYSYRRYHIFVWGLFSFIAWLYFGYAKNDSIDVWLLAPLIILAFPSLIIRFVFIPNGFVKSSYYFGLISTYYNRQDIKGGALLSSVLAYQKVNKDDKKLESWLLSKIYSNKDFKWASYLSLILLSHSKGSDEFDELIVSNEYLKHTLIPLKARTLTVQLNLKKPFIEFKEDQLESVTTSYRKIMSSINSPEIKEIDFFIDLNNYFLLFEGLDNKTQVSFIRSYNEKIADLATTLWKNGYFFIAKVFITWLVSKQTTFATETEVDEFQNQYHWYYWVRVLSCNTDGTNWKEVIKSAHKFLV